MDAPSFGRCAALWSTRHAIPELVRPRPRRGHHPGQRRSSEHLPPRGQPQRTTPRCFGNGASLVTSWSRAIRNRCLRIHFLSLFGKSTRLRSWVWTVEVMVRICRNSVAASQATWMRRLDGNPWTALRASLASARGGRRGAPGSLVNGAISSRSITAPLLREGTSWSDHTSVLSWSHGVSILASAGARGGVGSRGSLGRARPGRAKAMLRRDLGTSVLCNASLR